MKLDYVTYFRINESFKNYVFNKVIAYADSKYNYNEDLMFLRNAVESFLASIGITNIEFSRIDHKTGGYKNEDMIDLIYHSPNCMESNVVYTVHIIKGLHISCIDATVDAREENFGNTKVVCITHKTYMLYHDLDCNINNIEVEDNIANTEVGGE